LKDAVDETARLMERFGVEDEEAFESEVENLDGRVLATIKDFFGLLNDNRATLRLVSGNNDKSFRVQNIARAAERAKITTLDEDDIELPGQLSGALRESRIFEFRSEAENDMRTIKGTIDVDLNAEKISQINRKFADKESLAKFHVKRVSQHGRLLREKFTLLSIRGR
jgi:hypothetical protein